MTYTEGIRIADKSSLQIKIFRIPSEYQTKNAEFRHGIEIIPVLGSRHVIVWSASYLTDS